MYLLSDCVETTMLAKAMKVEAGRLFTLGFLLLYCNTSWQVREERLCLDYTSTSLFNIKETKGKMVTGQNTAVKN